MTSYKEKHQLVNEYVEENEQRFHSYEHLGFNNLTIFKETLIDFLETLEDKDYDIDKDGLCAGQVTDNLLGDPEDVQNFHILQAKKIIMTYMPWEDYLKKYGSNMKNISKFYEDYFYDDILNLYSKYNEMYGDREDFEEKNKKFTICVPLNKIQNCYKKNKNGTFSKLYGIKLKEEGSESSKVLLLPNEALIENTKYSDRKYFEIEKGMLYGIIEDGKTTDFCLSSEDIELLSKECNFYLDKLKELKKENEGEME